MDTASTLVDSICVTRRVVDRLDTCRNYRASERDYKSLSAPEWTADVGVWQERRGEADRGEETFTMQEESTIIIEAPAEARSYDLEEARSRVISVSTIRGTIIGRSNHSATRELLVWHAICGPVFVR